MSKWSCRLRDKPGWWPTSESFYDDMGQKICRADVIVCRAGATTLAELTAAGKAAILVPLPTATDDHQRKNAEALAASGAAEVLLQSKLTGSTIAQRIMALVADPDARARMAGAAGSFARPDAARVIVDRALELVRSERPSASERGFFARSRRGMGAASDPAGWWVQRTCP